MKFTGFHPQGEEEREPPLDLARLLLRQPSAALYAVMVGAAMREANIHDGDLLVIEAAPSYANGQIVLAFVDGTALVRRLVREPERVALQPAHPDFPAIELTDHEGWLIRGRVVASITLHAAPRFALPQAH
jgi:DNA polymerase V